MALRISLALLVLAASCAYGEPVDRDVWCDLNDCEITPAAAGSAGANTDG